MYMFLPFLIALVIIITVVAGKKKLTYALWFALLIITVFWFKYHATDALNLSF
ncbi:MULTISPECIES: DUF5993 family protein [Xenorhabdus]|uniref:Uncharacterized protein n=1 Tax=Xenorhabdus stockiae TaxID=351614 RepID=A0A2D0KBT3_9GAMM|nr:MULTISPECIES: DUF5993 family protein [Xenorhabdus]MCC8367745.1 hypothetical protein [Xenorhabdus sp. PB61.4]MCC8380847.1 hypothetical protein [Xenorhabdus sp. PB30.3]PHM49325.1 hypothetical protein Xekk_04343 [Xenorhabdus sp. KK7.4]PHM60840.1 hypothetical protein Xsto_03599 [Xenorhabdus stockiae]PHM69335.1 hypothetical protein Xekj_02585 [Xenorhabdus sp. KJ12.1]